MPRFADYAIVKLEDGILNVSMAPPVAISGWTLQFQLSKRAGSTSGLIKSCASGFNGVSGITVTDGSQGVFRMTLNSVDTSGVDFGNLFYNVTRLDSGSRTVLTEGYNLVNP